MLKAAPKLCTEVKGGPESVLKVAFYNLRHFLASPYILFTLHYNMCHLLIHLQRTSRGFPKRAEGEGVAPHGIIVSP